MLRSLAEIIFQNLTNRPYTPSPIAWEDQVLYFLLIDRFSNHTEAGFVLNGSTPLYQPADNGNAITNDADIKEWKQAGKQWAGGTIKGIINKLGYIQGMGITTVWISPVFKQVAFQPTYHGYGIQNFLEVDSHFGTKEELKDLVKQAHVMGMYVILDIIINHTGNIFSYEPDRYLTIDNGSTFLDPRWDGKAYTVKGFNNAAGKPTLPFSKNIQANEEDAIWPVEFQDPECFTQKGRIVNWEYEPEYCQGDFYDLKDISLGTGEIDGYKPSRTFRKLCEVYKYWIAFLDIDGYRLDTVKHMDAGAVRIFSSVIHEFAQTIGKENFYLIGEITGSKQFAFEKLEKTGIDAALGLDQVQEKLEKTVKGLIEPEQYFNLFKNSLLVGTGKESHAWFRNKVVTMIDDHDKVSEGSYKTRFCANEHGDKLLVNALAFNVMTLGIPCIYYGTEQQFDGEGGSDYFLREAMFGGSFGAFRSKGRHFFDTNHTVYKELAAILQLRKEHLTLRRGRQYLREISGDGVHFGLPRFMGNQTKFNSIIAWSRIMDKKEMVLAINTDMDNDRNAWITIDNELHETNDEFELLYPRLVFPPLKVEDRNGKAIPIQVPKAGFVLFSKKG